MKKFVKNHAFAHFGQNDEPRQTVKTLLMVDDTSNVGLFYRGAIVTKFRVKIGKKYKRVFRIADAHFVRDAKGNKIADVQVFYIPFWVRSPTPMTKEPAEKWIADNQWAIVPFGGSST